MENKIKRIKTKKRKVKNKKKYWVLSFKGILIYAQFKI